MEYQVLTVNATWKGLAKATRELTDTVNWEINNGWEPQGGVSVAAYYAGQSLLQALVKRHP